MYGVSGVVGPFALPGPTRIYTLGGGAPGPPRAQTGSGWAVASKGGESRQNPRYRRTSPGGVSRRTSSSFRHLPLPRLVSLLPNQAIPIQIRSPSPRPHSNRPLLTLRSPSPSPSPILIRPQRDCARSVTHLRPPTRPLPRDTPLPGVRISPASDPDRSSGAGNIPTIVHHHLDVCAGYSRRANVNFANSRARADVLFRDAWAGLVVHCDFPPLSTVLMRRTGTWRDPRRSAHCTGPRYLARRRVQVSNPARVSTANSPRAGADEALPITLRGSAPNPRRRFIR
ncbi:hypothetical protein BD413DRAFT_188482 [Trametes elegans]|nr:hypothetical protein BD413DRAFT_188482 [Trametes elegans]